MSLTIQKYPDPIVLVGNPVTVNVSSDTATISNHKIHIRLTGDGNTFEDSLPVINNNVSFDISDYFNKLEELQLNIFDLFNLGIKTSPVAVIFYNVRIFETYNNDEIEHNPLFPSLLWPQQGGFSTIFLKNYNAELKSFYNQFLQVDKKFLTWSENKKLGINQHEILYFMPITDDTYYPKFTIYFSDATTQVITGDNILLQTFKVAWLIVSYLANGFSALETPIKLISKYEVSIFNDANELVSEVKTYYVDRTYYNQERQFIFKNSLGGYDIIMLKGISESTDEIQRTVGFFQTEDITTFSSFKETFVANSGFLVSQFKNPKEAKQYIIELINSREIYEISGKEFIPVIPADKKIKISQDDNFLYAFEFNYQYAYEDEFYSPFDSTQYLNPIILYRNPVVTNAIQGQTAILDFEVMINLDVNVDLEINWGPDVGSTFINTTLVNGVWKPIQTSILIPANATLDQTIEITDSIGGKFSIPYTITEAIVITTDQSSLQTVGINLTFASGDIEVQWGDGTAVQAFATGVELTKDYAGTGVYQISIYGDLENITKFIADNSRITFIQGLRTGILTEFTINGNLYSGILDMTNAPINTKFVVFSNLGLTGIIFSTLGNGQITDFRAFNCNLTGTLDLTNVPIATSFQVSQNSILTGITFAGLGNAKVTSFTIGSCNFTGNLNLVNVPVGGSFTAELNPLLTGIAFANSGNSIITNLQLRSCNITGILNLANVPVGAAFNARSNALLTNVIFSITNNIIITNFQLFSCNITGDLDLINVPVGGIFQPSSNPLLTSITFSVSGNTALSNVAINDTGLPNIDFTIFSTSDNIILAQEDCNLSETEHDNQVINLNSTGWINGAWAVETGNAARTAASDVAYNNLIVNGWAII